MGSDGQREHERSMESPHVDPFQPIAAAPADRPFVVAQLGQSLDGRIATVTGESRYINGSAALDHLHGLRAAVDAVVVGVGTVLADDPLLTVRRVAGRSPARVVIDPRGRVGTQGKWLTQDGAPLLLVTACDTCPDGVEPLRLPLHNGALRPSDIVAALFALGYRKLLIEGGARTISSFIDAGCVNRLHLLVAPVIIGSGKMGLDLAPQGDLSRALRPTTNVHLLRGGEVLFDCVLL